MYNVQLKPENTEKEGKETNNKCNEQKVVTNIVDINPTKTIITLYVNCQIHQLKGGDIQN